MKKYSIEKITIMAILILGVLASLVQFLYNNSFWQDETYLALNIIHRSAGELLQPLDYFQVAPILFLQIEKFFSVMLPDTEMGLRIFPLLSFWMAVYLFYRIVKKLDGICAIVCALSFFALGYMYLYYSNEVKQYMSDVAVLLFVFYTVTRDYKKEKHKYWLLGITGVIAVFLSNVAPIILFTCGVYLVYDFFVRKTQIIPLLALFLSWSGAFLLYYCFFIHAHPSQAFMVNYWQECFLPLNPFKADFYAFLVKIPMELFTAFFTLNIYKSRSVIIVCGLLLLFAAGLIRLIREKNIKLIIWTCVPVLLHLALSAIQLYPFARRLILYLTPGVIIVCAWGFDYFVKIATSKLKYKNISLIVALIPLLFSSVLLFSRFPVKTKDTKERIKYMEEHIHDSKNIYLFGGESIILKYYRDIGFLNSEMNIINERVFVSNGENMMSRRDVSTVIDELKLLHNKNWILFSGTTDDKQSVILSRLDSLGYDRLREFHATSGAVYLYDFGE